MASDTDNGGALFWGAESNVRLTYDNNVSGKMNQSISASRSSSIYQNNATIRPQNISVLVLLKI